MLAALEKLNGQVGSFENKFNGLETRFNEFQDVQGTYGPNVYDDDDEVNDSEDDMQAELQLNQ